MFGSLAELYEQIRICSRCSLRESATAPVHGIGDIGSKYMLIGEAPGRHEDEEGMLFIGDAGRKLNQLLELAKINSSDCYITNTCKCRPPIAFPTPTKKHVKACLPWLLAEIRLVKPEYIITLGAVPLNIFSDKGIMQMHGTLFQMDIPDDDTNDGKRLPREPLPIPKVKKVKI